MEKTIEQNTLIWKCGQCGYALVTSVISPIKRFNIRIYMSDCFTADQIKLLSKLLNEGMIGIKRMSEIHEYTELTNIDENSRNDIIKALDKQDIRYSIMEF